MEEDQYGNVVTGDSTNTVTAARGSVGTAALQGSNLTVTLENGVATFSGLSYNMAETMDIGFTTNASGVSAAASSNIVVRPAAASQLVIEQQPSPTVSVGLPFSTQPVIYEEDQYGNLKTGDNSTVITAALNSGSGPLAGTTTATVSGGIARFTNLSDSTAGVISLGFSGDSLTVGPSNNITVSSAAPFQLVIDTQPSAAATAGQPLATGPVVYEVDQYGNLETGDNSTVITASLASGNGPLRGTASVTVSGGVATFGDLFDDVAGIISLNFAGAGFTAGPSNNIFISPATPAKLVIQTPPYSSVTAGNPLTDPIVIDEEDQYGNVETGDNSTVVTASLNSGAGTLDGTTTATVAAGVASFNDLEDDTAGSLSLEFAAGNLPALISNPSTVTAAPASQIVVNRPPSGVIAGITFTLVVDANDPYGNLATSYSGPFTVALASGSSGTLSGTLSVSAASGVATFNDLVDDTSGSISLVVTSGSLTQATASGIPVTAATAAKLIVQSQPSQAVIAGVPLNNQPVIALEDQYGNLETNDSSTAVTVALASGPGALEGTLTATVSGGMATFSNLADDVVGTITIGFTGTGLTSAVSNPITISPATASKLVIETPPSPTATAGQAFATAPVIYEEDRFGNLETSDNSTVVTASLESGSGPLTGATVTVSGGVATFAHLADDTAETISLNFSGGGLTVGASSSVVITPAAASKLAIQTEPSGSATAGQALAIQPVIREEDQYGNLETSDNSTVITVSLAGGTGTLHGTATVSGGVATFTGLTDDTAGTFTLKFTGPGLTTATSTPITVVAAPATQLVVTTAPPDPIIAGQAFVPAAGRINSTMSTRRIAET